MRRNPVPATVVPTVQPRPRPSGTVLYVLAFFAKRSETFILREIVALQNMGVAVHVASLNRVDPGGLTPEEAACLERTLFVPRLYAPPVLAANVLALLRTPGRYVKALARVGRLEHRTFYFRLRALWHFLAVAYIARALRADRSVAHIHAHFASAQAEIALALSVYLDVPFSIMAHARDIYVDGNALPQKIAAARFAATCTSYNAEYLRELSPGIDPDRIPVVRCGVPVHAMAWAPPRTSAPPVILSIGRLVEKKGQRDLVEACRLMKADGLAFTCIMVGDGPLREALARDIQSKNVEDCVTLKGSLPYADVAAYYRQATVFVLPSRVAADGDREGLPVVLMEALAFGVPVVSTRSAGIPELIADEETGLLVPADDPAKLAAAITRLLHDSPARTRMSIEGRRRVEAEYDSALSAAHLASLFSQA